MDIDIAEILKQVCFWQIMALGALYQTYLLLRALQKICRLLMCWGRFGKKFAEFVEWERRRKSFSPYASVHRPKGGKG